MQGLQVNGLAPGIKQFQIVILVHHQVIAHGCIQLCRKKNQLSIPDISIKIRFAEGLKITIARARADSPVNQQSRS